ncbi:class I SAM-dependent methyltransferase [Methanofollis fontis]|uniref:SAM-dependent methyltransferase n=1 Tax=Methanofollis fontis TaxID=2052832 RepID=A0A483CS26_9EURY|nr:SAM-dependent methyltransferase [Methanofollis fontis]TAJ45021.1 SAM-dependent methyltransferase [Methanofollis fontis]
MRVRRVEKRHLAAAVGEEWVDPDRRPYVDGETAYVPVREGFFCDAEIPERRPYRGRPFQMVGDTAILHGERPTAEEVAAIVAWRRPACVLHLRTIDGVRRIPEAEVLYGEAHPVRHRENGLTYHLNPVEVMYAAGNLEERAHMGRIVRPGERVADMFAGIGYFTLPMAAAGARVHATEINPVSFGYLQENIRANRLSERVEAVCGDCRRHLTGVYERIVMGHFDAPSFLPDALSHAVPGTVIHLHAVGDATAAIWEALEATDYSATVDTRKVKKYGPHIWHVVHDVELL